MALSSITFKNHGAYNAVMTVHFFVNQKISGSNDTLLLPKIETSKVVVGNLGQTKLVGDDDATFKVPDNISLKHKIVIRIEKKGITTEQIWNESISPNIGNDDLCVESKGHLLNASVSLCEGERILPPKRPRGSDTNLATYTVEPATASQNIEAAEAKCYNAVQGKVAWDTKNTNRYSWVEGNVKNLCSGVTDEKSIISRLNCFSDNMPDYGWKKAIDMCKNMAGSSANPIKPTANVITPNGPLHQSAVYTIRNNQFVTNEGTIPAGCFGPLMTEQNGDNSVAAIFLNSLGHNGCIRSAIKYPGGNANEISYEIKDAYPNDNYHVKVCKHVRCPTCKLPPHCNSIQVRFVNRPYHKKGISSSVLALEKVGEW
jgi:hypothetical protein